jgi:hypothetical protein
VRPGAATIAISSTTAEAAIASVRLSAPPVLMMKHREPPLSKNP